MKTYALTAGLLIALLSMSAVPMDSSAKGTRESNGRHQSKGHPKSGVVGQSVLNYGEFCVQFGNPATPCSDAVSFATTVLAYSENGELVASVTTDEDGYFKLFLEPGTYILTAYTPPPTGFRVGHVVSVNTIVTVEKKQVAPAFVFSAYLFF